MNQRFDTILKSGTVVNQDGEGVRDIAIADGRIAEIGGLGQATAAEVIDCRGLHILPGVMDTQVHFREPGLSHKEDLETGSRSAGLGGVTAVFEMPNTDPLTIDAQAFTDKVKRGRHRMHCDFAFFIGGTREATPHHLTLVAPECYERLGTRAQMNPPVRSADRREGIWRGIEQGIIDVLGSDHAPHTLEEKAKTYPSSPSGMTGVQTLVPIMLDHVNAGRLSLARFVDLTSAGPARLYNIACKGRIAAGYDADFTIVDLKRSETITNEWIASRAGWTPYDGVRVKGWPVGTFLRGARVMWQGELMTPSRGEPVRFLETLKA